MPAPVRDFAPYVCAGLRRDRAVIAIGASTGGTQAIGEILQRLPADVPPIVVVQHMPPRFTGYFAERLNEHCKLEVREAVDGERLQPGRALIAPGGSQTEVVASGDGYKTRVYFGEPVNLHRPSVDVLFDSIASTVGANGLGVILTGMGSDGARGMGAMRRNGALTIAQDEATCLVYGMPERAIREGGVQEVLPLDRIAERLLRWAGEDETK
jgi:two-component system chemotaxis response regulator CheB